MPASNLPAATTTDAQRRLVLDSTVVARPFLCSELLIRAITPQTPLWWTGEAEAAAAGLVDPYWAFCWAGGQAVARYVLDTPEWIRGKRVVDFGCGGGVVGIAAARCGASVLAADIDPLALVALGENAALNRVTLDATGEDLVGRFEPSWDVVLIGDVTYERELTARVVPWLVELRRRGVEILLGDPRRGFLPTERLDEVARYAAPADDDPDGSMSVETRVYSVRAAG